MGIISLSKSPRAAHLAISLIRGLPLGMSLRLSDFLAERAARQTDTPTVQAVRLNQAVVRGLPLDHPALDEAVRLVFRTVARGYIYLFRGLRDGPEAMGAVNIISEDIYTAFDNILKNRRGLVVAGCHCAGFEHVGLSIRKLDIPIQALAVPNPTGIYDLQNEYRMRTGLSVTPITSQALRQALRTLRQPGVVMTAVDRPDPQGEMLTFFGKPARLPVGLARLAIRTRVPILVEGTWETSPGRYRADLLTVLEPPAVSDETQATMDFAQQVLSHLEAFIRQRPEQWLMFFPVWKDV